MSCSGIKVVMRMTGGVKVGIGVGVRVEIGMKHQSWTHVSAQNLKKLKRKRFAEKVGWVGILGQLFRMEDMVVGENIPGKKTLSCSFSGNVRSLRLNAEGGRRSEELSGHTGNGKGGVEVEKNNR